ncbi:MAG: TauD/TfdA family dioxygenase [Candidatus Thioglobus sp.]|nr:TauD/TfdA family dioxygenase [Candidatus Thioglobus pontius]MBL6976634.1 TauD/TfdA family dioxygenase [Candidatus Thioglobus sp.]MBL6984131.1 TauD/TfdA family dioxygenase [Candidatus Thioglobus sp.]
MRTATHTNPASSPFLLDNNDLYKRWRDKKLSEHPTSIADLLIEVNDPRSLSKGEYEALLDLTQRANMAIYIGNTGANPSAEIPMAIANKFGLGQINKNWLADDNGLTSLTVVDNGERKNYIPYTNKPIHWHTDGYYNAADKQIHALNLHVVQKAAEGGENQLMDHEIAYILLREKNPDFIHALMNDNVMMIPAGTKPDGSVRPDRPGPVFSVTKAGNLHMRYTARARNIEWSPDPLVQEAVGYLQEILNDECSDYVFRGLLEPGMGLISNNVLHDRAAFTDSKTNKRHYYRARYFDRLKNTDCLI